MTLSLEEPQKMSLETAKELLEEWKNHLGEGEWSMSPAKYVDRLLQARDLVSRQEEREKAVTIVEKEYAGHSCDCPFECISLSQAKQKILNPQNNG